MRRLALAGLAAAAVAGAAAVGGPSSQVAWTLETVRFVASGDAARGKTLHGDCDQCHGESGVIDTPDVPNLAGQDRLYTFKQLQDYKAKTRASAIMNDAAASLSDRDMADLAAFYAAQKPARPGGQPPAPDAAVRALVSIGDGPRLIAACDACHGVRGEGNPTFYGMPGLRSQKADDLAFELLVFRSGERANDIYRVMRDAAKRLTDAEIAGLAGYYAGVPPRPLPKTNP